MQKQVPKPYISNWKAFRKLQNPKSVFFLREEDIHMSLVDPSKPPTFQNLHYWIFSSLSAKIRNSTQDENGANSEHTLIRVYCKNLHHWQFVDFPPKKLDVWPRREFDPRNPPILIEYNLKKVFPRDLTFDELEMNKPYLVELSDVLLYQEYQYRFHCPQFLPANPRHLPSASQILVVKHVVESISQQQNNQRFALLTPDLYKIIPYQQTHSLKSIYQNWTFSDAYIDMETDCPKWVGPCFRKINAFFETMKETIFPEKNLICLILQYVFQPMVSLDALFCDEKRQFFIDGDGSVIELCTYEWAKQNSTLAKNIWLACTFKASAKTSSLVYCVRIPQKEISTFRIEAIHTNDIVHQRAGSEYFKALLKFTDNI